MSLGLTSARLNAHPPKHPYLSAGGSSSTDPLPVEVGLASDFPRPYPPPPPHQTLLGIRKGFVGDAELAVVGEVRGER